MFDQTGSAFPTCFKGAAAMKVTQALLDDLLERSVRTEFTYRHKWRKGDMLIWDNRAAMHRAYFDYDPDQYRLLYRVIVRGEPPF